MVFDFGAGRRFGSPSERRRRVRMLEVKVDVWSLGKLYVRNECHDQVLHIGWIIKVQN